MIIFKLRVYIYVDRFAVHCPERVVPIIIRFSIAPERAIVVAVVVASVGPLDIHIHTGSRRPIRGRYLSMDHCVQLDHIKVLNIAIRSKRGLDPGAAIAARAAILENAKITIGYIIVFVNGYPYVCIIIDVNTNIVGSVGSCDTHSNQVTIVPVPHRDPHIRNAD